MKSSPILLSLTLWLILAACSGTSPPAPLPTATPEPVTLLTEPDQATTEAGGPVSTPTATSPATATRTPVPTATARPTATATPTPEPAPLLKVNESLTTRINVRAGPGTEYAIVGQFEPGQEADVVGRNEAGNWWQVVLPQGEESQATGWVFGDLVSLSGDDGEVPPVEAPPPPPSATPAPEAEAQAGAGTEAGEYEEPSTPEELVEHLRCGKDFCVTFQAMVPIWDNGGCVGNHSIYITVLQGLPPGRPLDGVVVGDTFNNVEVPSGSHGPGRTEITLWNNSMTLYVKRHIDGAPYTSEESFNFTAHDELIPAEVLAANGYCDGDVENCRWAQQHNQVCRGHYSWRVTFHKFD